MAVLTQLVYLKFRAGAPAVAPVFRPTYRLFADTRTTHRARQDSRTTHRVRVDA